MFGSILNLVKDVATLPVSATVDVVNIVTLGAVSDEATSFTEKNLRRVGQDVDNLLDEGDGG